MFLKIPNRLIRDHFCYLGKLKVSGTNGTAVRKSCVVLGLRFSQFRA